MTFLERHASAVSRGFYRTAQGRTLSTLGIGTYLGELTEAADRAYTGAVVEAVAGGINVIDTAINYRHTRSEQNIGAALREVFERGLATRDDLLVCTKAGFLTPGAIPAGLLPASEIAANCHAMHPDFLEDQIGRSLRHLGLERIDVFYVHNPETQLQEIDRATFEARLRAAFAKLEQLCDASRIGWYGAATWSGYRLPADHPQALSLPRILELAREAAGGSRHRCRFMQLPLNLAMTEALQPAPGVLRTAEEEGITVVASAPMLQARLLPQIGEDLLPRLAGPATAAQFALQFARSAPGVTTALAGMSNTEHVRENLGLAGWPPATGEEFRTLFRAES